MVVLPRGLGIFVVGIIDEILCAQNLVGFSQILWELRNCPTQTVYLANADCAFTTIIWNALKCRAAFAKTQI